MDIHEVKTQFKGGMTFVSNSGGQSITMDAGEDVGGNNAGFRPKPLLLSALTGCTGMDVVSLLRKMRVEFTDFDLSAKAELGDEHPKTYQTIHLIYQVRIESDSDKKKFEKAVNLSMERYCGVHAMLAKAAKIDWEINYL